MDSSEEDKEVTFEPNDLRYIIEGWIVPVVSVVGLLGNSLTVLVLNHREVKLKKCLVDILCGLAAF